MDATFILHVVGALATFFAVAGPLILVRVIKRNHEQTIGGWLETIFLVIVFAAGWLVSMYAFVVIVAAPLARRLLPL